MTCLPVVEIKNLTKNYGSLCALSDINIEMQNEITGLVGPNGSGKSTLINILAGLMKPTDGFVSVLNKNPFKQPIVLQKMGFLREHAFYPMSMPVWQYLRHIARLRGIVADQTQKLLQQLSVPVEKPIGALSSGMFQKLGITIALMGNPEIVILDEPTANLDPVLRRTILDLIYDYHHKNACSFLISTHILNELETISDKFIVLNEGHVIAHEKPSKLRSKSRKRGEFVILVANSEQYADKLPTDPSIEIIARKGERWYLKIESNSQDRSDWEQLWQFLTKNKLEVIEISNSCDIEETFRRICYEA